MIDANYQLLVKGAAVGESNPLPSADAAVLEAVGDLQTAVEATTTAVGTLTTDVLALQALIGTAEDAAGANTLIGQLKQIAANTTPAG